MSTYLRREREGRLPEAFSAEVAFKLPILLPARVGCIRSREELSVFNARNGAPHLNGRISATEAYQARSCRGIAPLGGAAAGCCARAKKLCMRAAHSSCITPG